MPAPQCEAQFSSETASSSTHCARHPEPTLPTSRLPSGRGRRGPPAQHPLWLLCASPSAYGGTPGKQHPRLECGACQEAFPSRPALTSTGGSSISATAASSVTLLPGSGWAQKHYLEQHEEHSKAAAASAGRWPWPAPLRCPFCDFALPPPAGA